MFKPYLIFYCLPFIINLIAQCQQMQRQHNHYLEHIFCFFVFCRSFINFTPFNSSYNLFTQRMTTLKKKISTPLIQKVSAFLNNQQKLQNFIHNWQYRQELALALNLNALAQRLAEYFELDTASKKILQDYLIQPNLPIEVTLHPLRIIHLTNILMQWMENCTNDRTSNDKTKQHIFRNSLFRKVLSDGGEIINEYFSIDSSNVLIADDLFNLLQELTNQYFLYDCPEDIQTFFYKENSLLRFKEVVAQFCFNFHDTKEALTVNQTEFQEFIEFWQGKNRHLLLSDTPRKSIRQVSIQTGHNSKHDLQVQVSSSAFSFMDILNSTIAKLNAITAETASQRDLRSIERMYTFLKNQRMAIMKKQVKKQVMQKEQIYDKNQGKFIRFSTCKNYRELQINYKSQFTTFTPKHTDNINCSNSKKMSTSKNSTLV